MIKLRDLPYNQWNIDTLYLLCENTAKANELIQKLEFERFGWNGYDSYGSARGRQRFGQWSYRTSYRCRVVGLSKVSKVDLGGMCA